MTTNDVRSLALKGIGWQREALDLLAGELDETFDAAALAITRAGKVIATGIGKSGFVARKMAATLTSIRIPAVYLHPVDALHGDLGILDPGDVVVAFSKSGETQEVTRLAEIVAKHGAIVVSITSRRGSALGAIATYELVAPIVHELDPHNLLPTASTTQALVMADLLCVAAAQLNGDVVRKLQHSHPHGAIGAALLRTVDGVMHAGSSLPMVRPGTMVRTAVGVLSDTALGIVCVVDDARRLCGIITDGDVRRYVGGQIDLDATPVDVVMTKHPVSVRPTDTLYDALQIMEARDRQISVVPVVSEGECVGVLRLHDIMRAQL
jgi:arabinose-5-phosphate isomerase